MSVCSPRVRLDASSDARLQATGPLINGGVRIAMSNNCSKGRSVTGCAIEGSKDTSAPLKVYCPLPFRPPSRICDAGLITD